MSKVSDQSLLVLLILQAELGIQSQRHFYRICQLFPCGCLLDIRAVDDLLENCSQPYVLADLAYLSYELREQLKQKGYHLWTPLRQNMARAKQHNHWKLMAMRRTIETRFSELGAFFDVEQTLTRGLTGLQLRIEQIVLAYNLRYFEIN